MLRIRPTQHTDSSVVTISHEWYCAINIKLHPLNTSCWEEGWQVASPLVPVLLADSPTHRHNILWPDGAFSMDYNILQHSWTVPSITRVTYVICSEYTMTQCSEVKYSHIVQFDYSTSIVNTEQYRAYEHDIYGVCVNCDIFTILGIAVLHAVSCNNSLCCNEIWL